MPASISDSLLYPFRPRECFGVRTIMKRAHTQTRADTLSLSLPTYTDGELGPGYLPQCVSSVRPQVHPRRVQAAHRLRGRPRAGMFCFLLFLLHYDSIPWVSASERAHYPFVCPLCACAGLRCKRASVESARTHTPTQPYTNTHTNPHTLVPPLTRAPPAHTRTRNRPTSGSATM